MPVLQEFAPAKLNLALHVGAVQPDGYHPLSSLVMFADVGDTVGLGLAREDSFTIDGPFAEGLSTGEGNLCQKAIAAFFAHRGSLRPRLQMTLHKALPVASGLGGGSSDAGAVFRLLRRMLPPALPMAELETLARAVGADGPMCVRGAPAIASGVGEILAPAPPLPDLHAVLVNAGLPVSTGAVYRAFDAAPGDKRAALEVPGAGFADAAALIAFLKGARNDLQAPAIAVEPAVGAVVAALEAEPEARLTRVTGSGGTVFAVTADAEAARALAERVKAANAGWWVQATRLKGSPSGAA